MQVYWLAHSVKNRVPYAPRGFLQGREGKDDFGISWFGIEIRHGALPWTDPRERIVNAEYRDPEITSGMRKGGAYGRTVSVQK